MAKNQKSSVRKVTEADVDWAYNVLSTVKEAMDKVTGDRKGSEQLMGELVQQMPDVFEALIVLVSDEHRGAVGEAMMSWARWLKGW